ncbi:tRNA dihydrouridine synthase DusB [Acidipropionibacterium acidipropionici]|nr:tRNA dihydrouridine synthase DusB [Acidipropionibacterium acidipropionici]
MSRHPARPDHGYHVPVPAIPPLVLTAPSGGRVVSTTPVVLAPMAGVTNAAFRQLCAEQGAGLYVCEMITSRGLVYGDRKTHDMLAFADVEKTRSVQLYGVDPGMIAEATSILCEKYGVNHVDLNFGCPVPKVTRKGGGGVLPWKTDRFTAVVRAAVEAGDRHGVPVTVKTRIGIDDDHTTYIDSARAAVDAGAAAVCLHARTVAEAYAGHSHWEAIGRLVEAVDVPVLGNGDIWEADDALEMVRRTGCAGVEVGRGCLGRPWLFRDLADAFAGQGRRTLPNLGEVAAMIRRHAELLVKYEGPHGLVDMRKHMAWYLKGFPVGGKTRHALGTISSSEELDALLASLDADSPFPAKELGRPRGRQGTPRRKVVMPMGWLDGRTLDDADLSEAELGVSGG